MNRFVIPGRFGRVLDSVTESDPDWKMFKTAVSRRCNVCDVQKPCQGRNDSGVGGIPPAFFPVKGQKGKLLGPASTFLR